MLLREEMPTGYSSKITLLERFLAYCALTIMTSLLQVLAPWFVRVAVPHFNDAPMVVGHTGILESVVPATVTLNTGSAPVVTVVRSPKA